MAIRQQGDELGAEYPHIINQPRMPGYQQPSSPVIIITAMMAVEPDKRRKKKKKKKLAANPKSTQSSKGPGVKAAG